MTIFASNFKPHQGGIAEYTYQLANGLYEAGCLDRVVTTVSQDTERSHRFNVVGVERQLGDRWGDSIPILRKLNSFLYISKKKLLLYRTIFNLIRTRQDQHVLFTSLYESESKKVVSVCAKTGIRFSVVFHGLELIRLQKYNPSFLDKVCEGANLLAFNSKATKNLFTQLRSRPPEKSYILYPGINPAQIDSADSTPAYDLERRYNVDLRDKTVILSLARLVKRKGIDIALRALAPILNSSDEYRYIIAGDGPEYDALRSEVMARGLGDKVTLTGYVTDAEKYGLLEASTLFVMPNHTRGGENFEGFGISFIEASYFENVVIGGRSGGAVEAISEGESGYLLDFEKEGAEKELRTLIRRLLSDPDRVEEFARQGRNHVLECFQAPELVAEFAQSFDDMIEA